MPTSPTDGDPTDGDPTGGDPTGGEPTGGDPTGGNPTDGNQAADDLPVALGLADLADELTMARFGAADLAVRSKPDRSLVSEADQAVEQAIRQRLAELRPADALVGEEFGSAGGGARQWVIDPIDGTHNYVRSVPVWATLIALLVDGRPVVGVVSAPALCRRWWAAAGTGAFGRFADQPPRRLRVSGVRDLADASMSYSSLSGWAEIGRQPQFLALLDRLWRTRAFGDFWSYLLVAEGAVDLAAEPELALWDMAALAPIVTEAGGRFTGLDGVDGVHSGNAAASNGLLHDALLAALACPGSAGPAPVLPRPEPGH